MRKGQTALEYLITYGWAILVILVVAAFLWYYGVFTPKAPEKITGFTVFTVPAGGYSLSTTGLQMVLQNRLSDTLKLNSINVSGDCYVTTKFPVAAIDQTVSPGGKSNMVTVTGGGWTCGSLAVGDMAKMQVAVSYNDTKTGATNLVDTGEMFLKIAS